MRYIKTFLHSNFMDALKKLVLLSATIHLVLLFIYSIVKSNMRVLNYFDIIHIDLFFPKIANGPSSQIYSIFLIVILYFFIYFVFSRKRK